VKAVCLPEGRNIVERSLEETKGVKKVIVSGLGSGARLVDDA
jgi:hypothetical protein